jgi:succinylarginine dihydrolase
MTTVEANYDGLVGPTHNYAGLSAGNLASAANEGLVANPKEAALQGLAKMQRLMQPGLVQGVLPPHERPAIWRLRELGFQGTDEAALETAAATDQGLVRRVSSASAMWAANAATVSPSPDTADGRLHVTPANLLTMPHRALESAETTRALRAAFPGAARFAVHPPLPAQADFGDEGAANHMRLCAEHGAPGVEIFVYGRSAYEDFESSDLRFPARQSLQACLAIARRAGLEPTRTVFLRQSPEAINAGAFHNDVVAVASERTLLFHEQAFADKAAALEAIRRAADGLFEPVFVEVTAADVPLKDAVASYLLNSQLIRPPGQDRQTLLAPSEAYQKPSALRACEALAQGNGPIGAVDFIDLRQSMRNGGGPACLRLRVVLTEAERAAAHPGLLLDATLHARLVAWVAGHYRDRLAPEDLGDPALLRESRRALDELTGILGLGADFYPFQRA